MLRTAAVLTIVDEPAPPDAFRPPFVGGEKPVFLARNLRRDKLPCLAQVPGTPEIDDVARIFARPWLDHKVAWTVRAMHPIENMPGYGREIARGASSGALMLCGDLTAGQKEKLLIGYVQTGIDLYYTVQAGGGWPANGGHSSGRKIVILVAGLMLDDRDMLAVEGPFGEDMQTYYGKGWTGATAIWQIYWHTGKRAPYEHLRPVEWTSARDEGYRRCCTSLAWVGQALAARKLGLLEHWQHDAFFDYVDRWMTEEDTDEVIAAFQESEIPGIKGMLTQPGAVASGTVWDEWVKEMWVRHRGTINPIHPPGEILGFIKQGKPLPD
jgi:hypothetical protein